MPTDVMKPSQRYKAMVSNRGRTRPERTLASSLWKMGFRYLTAAGYKSRCGKSLPGNPDIILSRRRIVIFVDGCFWHGCSQCRKHEGLNGEFWVSKIEANRDRDLRVTGKLTDAGWTVFRIPEHDVRTKTALAGTVNRLVAAIRAESSGRAALDTGDNGVRQVDK